MNVIALMNVIQFKSKKYEKNKLKLLCQSILKIVLKPLDTFFYKVVNNVHKWYAVEF